MFDAVFGNTGTHDLLWLTGFVLGFLVLYFVIITLVRRFGKNPRYLIPRETVKAISVPLFFVFLSFLVRLESLRSLLHAEAYAYFFEKGSTLLFIFSTTWLVLRALSLLKKRVMDQHDIAQANNLKARQIYTQFSVLENIVVFLVVTLAIAGALMSFEGIRKIGLSIFASAGVAGIIVGFSAQKMIATIVAGVQIALTQPIKIDDVVIVEGEWGNIEKINLTYVVVRIWDKRRLIVPSTYFISQPFQNWTKTSADILGTVFLYTDYNVPIEALRAEQTRILEGTDLWDGQVNVIQVTDSKPEGVEIRCLVSAINSPTAWDLRVLLREKLIGFLQQNYPESIVRRRVVVDNIHKDRPNT